MKCKHLLTLGVVSMAMSCFSDVPLYGQGAPKKITFESIQEAWRQRQKKFASAIFTLAVERKQSQLHALKMMDRVRALQNPAAAAKLQSQYRDTRLETQVSVRGDCMAYHERPSTPNGKPRVGSFVKHFASDGVVSAFLDQQGDVFSYPTGQVLGEPRCFIEGLMDLLPITWEIGNRDRVMPKPKHVRVTEASAATLVGSHACVVLELPEDDAGRSVKTYWLDPDTEYSILKFAHAADRKVAVQIDSHYERTKEGCWVPTKWTATAFSGDGSPDIITRVVATHYELNPAFPEGEFQITFPPGTVVTDPRLGFEGFLVKPDGSKRMITRDEVFAPYEELMKTETGKAHTARRRVMGSGIAIGPRDRSWRRLWLIANASLILVLCGLFYVRRRIRRYKS